MTEIETGSRAVQAVPRKKSARRAKGSGGIFLIRDGVWRIDVEVARDPVTRKRRRVSRTVHGSREDAEVAAAKLRIADHEHRLQTGKTSARSVQAALQQYIGAAEAGTIELAPSTLVTSRSAVRTMCQSTLSDGRVFGAIKLSKLTWKDVELLYEEMRGRPLSKAWIRRCGTVLSRSLDFARKRGLMDVNPAKDAVRPKVGRKKPYSPPPDLVRAVLKRAFEVDPDVADGVLILASTGMRRGEMLALRWCDIDFDSREVTVEAALVDGGPGVGIIRKTTKQSDWRDVPLTATACEALLRQRSRLCERFDSLADDDFVFPSPSSTGELTRPDQFSKSWLTARGADEITIQHIRHYTATTMLDAGESYRTVADILGNSEATVRLHYDGRTDPGKRQAISALEF